MREKIAEKWKRFTSPLISRIPRLSRPWRVARNLVCIVLGVYLIWLFAGAGALTAERAFRRAEKQDMVGPSEILLERREGDQVTFTGRTESGYYIGTFAKDANLLGGWYTRGRLFVDRQEDVTFSVAKCEWGGFGTDYVDLLLLCDDPAVSRGEAEITIAGSGRLNGKWYDFDEVYTVEFLPAAKGVLSGWLEAASEDDWSWESQLERLMLGSLYTKATPVTIRLYDGGGELLLERSMEYRYPME